MLTVKTGSAGTEQAGSDGDEPAEPATSSNELLDQLRQEPDWEQLPFFRRLRRIRKARDWSLPQLAGRMVLVGRQHKGRTATASSLKSMISRWENDEIVPDDRNRRLLADALGCQVADLGLTVDPDVIW
ncbi:helix-turn-helix domain-containing protein [Actinoplanes sp. CA-030573]|uniref:helix-turn-helix domain-containing protein n=1 Tax=Actinoplanes sp. CA-030573 TaxID=3239898 RepID=UPI003D9483DF